MRWKLLVGNIVAVLLVGILGWFLTSGRAADALVTDVDPSVMRSSALLDAVRAQESDQFLDAVEAASRSPDVLAVLAADSESAQRDAAHTFAEAWARQIGTSLPRKARPAELLAVVSADGRVVGRNTEARLDAGRNLSQEFPVVAHALAPPSGHAVRDYIRYGEQGWLEVAVAPVLQNGQIRGGLLVGFALADSAARADAQRVGVDVGYLFREGDACRVQSLSVGQQEEKEQLRAWCTRANLGTLLRARQRVTFKLGADDYLATVVPMPGAYTARAAAGGVAFPILLATLLGLLLVVGLNLYLAFYMEKPIEQIEDGLLQIINGNREHRINVEHPELGGIVYRVNQLVAELTGVEEEGSGGSSGGGS